MLISMRCIFSVLDLDLDVCVIATNCVIDCDLLNRFNLTGKAIEVMFDHIHLMPVYDVRLFTEG